MKTVIFIIGLISSFEVFSTTNFNCHSDADTATYSIEINDELTKLVFLPTSEGSSVLSNSSATLKYNEGESGDLTAVFEGKNQNKNFIVLELDIKKASVLLPKALLEITAFCSDENPGKLDQVETLVCAKSE